MNLLHLRWVVFTLIVGTLAVLSAGCILPDGGYGYDDGGGVGAAYYEPYGVDYGGWGPGYEVAPFRGGGHRPSGGGGHAAAHAYRSAPASRSVPSIPSHSGGGARGGSGGGGGGRR